MQAKIRYCWTGHLIRVSDQGYFCFVTKVSIKLTYCDEKRGSYISDHVILNLLNELGKSDKIQDLPSILSHFRNKFNIFINTGTQMIDSIYHMT